MRSDFFVLDLEDSISIHESEKSFENIKYLTDKELFYVRPRLQENGEKTYEQLINLINLGYTKFILPKISSNIEILEIAKIVGLEKNYSYEKCEFILLVENPLCLLSLVEISRDKLLNFSGLAFGSHDYTDLMEMKHIPDNLSYPRHHIITVAKAYNLSSIDIASTNIHDEFAFHNECLEAFSMGFHGKFILHPMQLEIIKSARYFTDEEIEEAYGVYRIIKYMNEEEFSVIKYNGKIFERPHLKRIYRILDWIDTKNISLNSGKT